MTRILIVGATSSIASHCARIWAQRNAHLVLAARNEQRLADVAADLRARGAATVSCHPLDVTDFAAQQALIAALHSDATPIDIALIAHGQLPDEDACDKDPLKAVEQFTTNASATIAIMSALAERMRRQGKGQIAVISSVAGDRGRASNAHYGAAKAAVSVFCDGLRLRLKGSGVNVLTIKPGMVATPMTSQLSLPPFLVSTPDRVAADICAAIDRSRATLYTPWWWAWIMRVIRLIPEPVFSRLKL